MAQLTMKHNGLFQALLIENEGSFISLVSTHPCDWWWILSLINQAALVETPLLVVPSLHPLLMKGAKLMPRIPSFNVPKPLLLLPHWVLLFLFYYFSSHIYSYSLMVYFLNPQIHHPLHQCSMEATSSTRLSKWNKAVLISKPQRSRRWWNLII